MNFLNFFKTDKENKYSQSGQDQFAYNISGSNGLYLEIGAHHPIINSNTFVLEKLCNWKGISIEYDISFKEMWDNSRDRNNKIIWDDAFNIDYSNLVKKNGFPNKFNYLSCDIEPVENTFLILQKIINSNLSFDYISFEHDKYNFGDKYEKLSEEFLKKCNYKVGVKNVYSRNKKYKIYETWFVNNEINFNEIEYENWKKKFYKKNEFSIKK